MTKCSLELSSSCLWLSEIPLLLPWILLLEYAHTLPFTKVAVPTQAPVAIWWSCYLWIVHRAGKKVNFLDFELDISWVIFVMLVSLLACRVYVGKENVVLRGGKYVLMPWLADCAASAVYGMTKCACGVCSICRNAALIVRSVARALRDLPPCLPICSSIQTRAPIPVSTVGSGFTRNLTWRNTPSFTQVSLPAVGAYPPFPRIDFRRVPFSHQSISNALILFCMAFASHECLTL